MKTNKLAGDSPWPERTLFVVAISKLHVVADLYGHGRGIFLYELVD